jgi:hypothetical protein
MRPTGPAEGSSRRCSPTAAWCLVPAFPDLPGVETWLLKDGRHVGDDHPWFDDADRRSYEQVEQAFRELSTSVDPDDPWSHPRARELDDISVAA